MKRTVLAATALAAITGTALAGGEAGKVVAVIDYKNSLVIGGFYQFDETGAVRSCALLPPKTSGVLNFVCSEWADPEPWPVPSGTGQ